MNNNQIGKTIIEENKKVFPVKYCLDCEQVFELDGTEVWYHSDFPTYGLERETCCGCEKN